VPTPRTQIPGYHYSGSEDGEFAIEVDTPCEGAVTLTWKPKTFPGEPKTIEMPAGLFINSSDSYAAERRLPQAAK
jgi:hypothetical protein